MGRGRTTRSGPSKKFHSIASDNKRRELLRHATASARSDKPGKRDARLRDLLPEVGMIYPFDHVVLEGKRDVAITTTLRKAASSLGRKTLNRLFSHMFAEAATMMQHGAATDDIDNPIAFLRALQKRDALQPWAKAMLKQQFIALFLVLRAARENWHANPQPPMDPRNHCKLAQAIDDFNKGDTLNWSSDSIVKRLVQLRKRGGLVSLGNDEGEDAEMEEEPTMLAGHESAQVVGCKDEEDNDEDALAEAFRKLMLQ
jgi:hypothetical protein